MWLDGEQCATRQLKYSFHTETRRKADGCQKPRVRWPTQTFDPPGLPIVYARVAALRASWAVVGEYNGSGWPRPIYPYKILELLI